MAGILRKPREQWVHELERDLMALGSVVFYFLVIGRALVGPFWDLFIPLAIIAVIIIFINFISQEFDLYIARGIVMAIFVTRHYGDIVFGIFAAVVMIAMIISSVRLGTPRQKITRGALLGLICSALLYPFAVVLDM